MHHLSFLNRTGRLATRILPFLAPLFLTGCSLRFWHMDGHQTTMIADGPVAQYQLDVFIVTCWVTFVIFVVVGAVLAYATIKFKARSDADEHAEPPPQGHGNPVVEMGLIAASVFALVIIAIPTLKGIWYTYDVPADQAENAYEVLATGEQWWFRFQYPEQIEGVGPLQTGNELVIPAGRPVRVQLRTTDVIHSFWVPKLAGKVDMIPNRGNFLWLQADEPGYFWGQCAEYCGDSHAVMRFRVIALSEEDFAAWVESQKAPAREVAAPADPTVTARPVLASFSLNQYGFSDKWAADATVDPLQNWRDQQEVPASENAALIQEGRMNFLTNACIACHTIRGHNAFGITGPDLTHIGSRTTIAGGLLENTPEQLARWIAHPDQVKPGNKMYVNGYVPIGIEITEEEAVSIAAYLGSLK